MTQNQTLKDVAIDVAVAELNRAAKLLRKLKSAWTDGNELADEFLMDVDKFIKTYEKTADA